MTQSMMERCAFAIFASGFHPKDVENGKALELWNEPWGLWEDDVARAKKQARSVIEALREPTEAMLAAEVVAYNKVTGKPQIKNVGECLWQAMLDAIIKEGEG